MKQAVVALSLLAAALAAQAQLRLPQLPNLPRLPGVVDRVLPQPLPDLLSSATQLVDQRLTNVRELLTRHRDLIEADPAGEPIRRRELVLVSPSDAALAAAAALGLVKL